HCPVKAIRFSGNQAHIINDECILCGQCFVVCPQNAKEIVDTIGYVKVLISENDKVIASLAPSFAAYFENAGIGALEKALKKLGFYAAEETAIGATIVKRAYEELIKEGKEDIIISSCCHSVNLLIEKYYPELLKYLAPVVTPMHAHCLDIKRRYPDAKTVFIGPCVAKKDEGASEASGAVDAVLTFEELSEMLQKAGIELEAEKDETEKSRARLFPTVGGILRTMDCQDKSYTYITVDGTENCKAALSDIANGKIGRCFIEMSSCEGSCIGGPIMEKYGNSPVRHYKAVDDYAGEEDFEVDMPDSPSISVNRGYKGTGRITPSEREIREVLAKTGKLSPEDELNCGTCGYNTCREKAIAVLQGKADINMCLPFLMEKSERFSNNILSNTPNGIIVVNEELEVQQLNKSAMKMMNISSRADVLGEHVMRIMDPIPFIDVLENGKRVFNRRDYFTDYQKYFEQTIVHDKNSHILISLLRDVTDEETERREKEALVQQTAEITDKVVDKQMRIVQEIASLLGETAAETKIALTKLKESMSHDEK
ncbi:MAG: [Fe-Fe] hydrogenase large subunit C-terminal domain-containing protein, partial [Eubacteriales bacterium]